VSLRRLARASALYMLGNLAPKVGAVLLLPIYVRFLTREEYGSLALLTSISGLLTIIYRLGLDSSLMRLHFDTSGSSRATLYSTLTLFTLAAAGGMTLVVAIASAPFFTALFSGIVFVPLGALALLLAFMSAIQYVPSAFYRATGQAARFVTYNVGAFVLASAASVILIVVIRLGVLGILLGQLVGASMILVVGIIVVGRLGRWSFSSASLATSLRVGIPLLPHSVAAWVLRLSDRWLLGLLLGLPAAQALGAVGSYSFGYQVAYIVSIVVTSFNSAWSPYFFRVGALPHGPILHRHVTSVAIAGLLGLAVAISALGPEIVAVIARPEYAAAAEVMPVIAFASVLQGFYTMIVTAVFLSKRTGWLAAITVASAALNIGLNLVLIRPMGIMGAAWATVGAYGFFAAATWLYGRRVYPIQVDAIRLTVLAGVAIAAVVVAGAIRLPGNPLAQGGLHLLVAIVFGCIAAGFAFGPLMGLRGLGGYRTGD